MLDDSIQLLMVEFSNQLDDTGNKAEALEQSMLTTVKTFPEPKNLAVFTLIGEAN